MTPLPPTTTTRTTPHHHTTPPRRSPCTDPPCPLHACVQESITKAAGAAHGQELTPRVMEELIRGVGRTPRQRTTLYGAPPAAQTAKSYDAAPLLPPVFAAPTAVYS